MPVFTSTRVKGIQPQPVDLAMLVYFGELKVKFVATVASGRCVNILPENNALFAYFV